MNLSEARMPVLGGNLFRRQGPILYQPAMRITVTPVPAILGRAACIAGSRSIKLPISTALVIIQL